MKLKERFSGLDHRIKIASVLGLILIIGFAASNIPGLNSSDSSMAEKQKLSHVQSELAYSGGSGRTAESGNSGNKIVTTVRTTIKVRDVDRSMDMITSRVNELGGYVESSSIEKERENRGSMTVKVPDRNLSEFESSLEDKWKVKSKRVNQEDVTDSYNELKAEIESLKAEYNRLQELINQTDKVETLIKLQERMSEVRSQLNYKQQRLDDLKERVQYSEVHITLEGPQSFKSKFNLRETFSDAYGALFDSLRLMIVGVAYLTPFVLVYLVYRAAKRLREEGF